MDKAATVIVMVPNLTAQDEVMKTVLSQAQVRTSCSGEIPNMCTNSKNESCVPQVAAAAIAVTSLTADSSRGMLQSLVLQNPHGPEVRNGRLKARLH